MKRKKRYTFGVGSIAQGVGGGAGMATGAGGSASAGKGAGGAAGMSGGGGKGGGAAEMFKSPSKDIAKKAGAVADLIGMYGAIRGGDKGKDAVDTASMINNVAGPLYVHGNEVEKDVKGGAKMVKSYYTMDPKGMADGAGQVMDDGTKLERKPTFKKGGVVKKKLYRKGKR